MADQTSTQSRRGIGVGTNDESIVWADPIGWRLVGTDRWWPAMFGPPPETPGLTWEPLYG